MDALEAVLTRHSVPPAFLAEPAPDDATLERILAAGASAPDHGRLRPWRFIVIRGPARARLGEVFAEALVRRQPDAPAAALEQERARPLRAPLLIVVGARLEPQHPKIPEIEQILSTAAAAQSILIVAHAITAADAADADWPARDSKLDFTECPRGREPTSREAAASRQTLEGRR